MSSGPYGELQSDGCDSKNAFKWNRGDRQATDHRVESARLSRNSETFSVLGKNCFQLTESH